MLVVAVGVVFAAPTLTLTPNRAPRDDGKGNQTVIQATGSFGTTLAGLSVYWDTQDTNHQQTPSNVSLNQPGAGDFSFDVTVPLTVAGAVVRPGTHPVIVSGTPVCTFNCIALTVSAPFTVPAPTAQLSNSQGRQGDGLFVFGSGFSPASLAETIRIIWDPSGTPQTLYEGQPGFSAFNVTITVPDVAVGKYTIRVCDVPVRLTTCNSADSATAPFTIVSPIVALDHASGLANATVNVSGSRFHGGRELHIWFGTAGAPKLHEVSPGTPKQTNSDGFFGPYPYSPTDAPGKYVVTACTYSPIAVAGVCDPNDTDTAAYTILAPPTPTPSPTPQPTATLTPTGPPTASPTPSPTVVSTPTASPIASASATATGSLLPTLTPAPTAISTPTSSAAASATPVVLPSPTPPQTVGPATAPPTTAPPTPAPSSSQAQLKTWPEHLHGPGDPTGGVSDLATIGGIGLLALLIAFLVPFPGTLFNKTVEANYAEIQGWIAGARGRWNGLLDGLAVGPIGGLRRRLGWALQGRTGVFLFLALSALVYGFLSPAFGFDLNSAALFLGLLVGLGFVTAAFDLPLRFYHRRRSKERDAGVLRALWWTLAIAVVCVAVSRLAGFQPGYLYGLIISIVFVTDISTREEGIGTWLASAWLLVLSFVAWIALALVRQGNADPWLSLFLQTVLVTFVVAGIETLVIGLLPMRFLPGHPLFRWRKSMWFALFALSVFGYLLILVDPANGYLSSDSQAPMIVGIVFLVVFGVISIGTWAYFRYRPARAGGDRPGEATAT